MEIWGKSEDACYQKMTQKGADCILVHGAFAPKLANAPRSVCVLSLCAIVRACTALCPREDRAMARQTLASLRTQRVRPTAASSVFLLPAVQL